jgi:IS30 family transposase
MTLRVRERKSRDMIIIKNQNKEAVGTALALINSLKTAKEYIKSITFDQGNEFKKYPWIKDCLNTDIYFCEAASPHQKGAIENRNGVIRTQLPRTLNASVLKQKTLNKLSKEINNRPLKCLNYKTFQELLDELRKP